MGLSVDQHWKAGSLTNKNGVSGQEVYLSVEFKEILIEVSCMYIFKWMNNPFGIFHHISSYFIIFLNIFIFIYSEIGFQKKKT